MSDIEKNLGEEQDFGPDYVTLQDEDGTEYELEVLGAVEVDGNDYMAFCDANVPDDTEALEIIIFRVEENDDGTLDYVGLDSDEELQKVYAVFLEEIDVDEDDE